MRRAILCTAASLLIALALRAADATSQATAVDVQLVLAADASASIDEGEHRLQRLGYAQALRDPRVIHAIQAGDNRAIAVTYVEWTGEERQAVIVPWTVIRDAESAERVAQQLLTLPRSLREGGTAVGEAIFYAASLFERSGFESERKVIDLSGDGDTNRGRPASMGRDFAAARGITVNGLPILTDFPHLDIYYQHNVVGGPNAFLVPATGFQDLADAVLQKLIREVAGRPAGSLAQAHR